MIFREKQQILIYAIAGLIVGGGVLLRYLPLRKKIKSFEQVRSAQETIIANASSKKSQLPVLKAQLLQLQSTAGNYQENIPDQQEIGVFLQQITNLMNKCNLKDQIIKPGREQQVDELYCIAVDMQCKGELSRIFEFYKSLEDMQRQIRIRQVKLENDEDFSGEVSMQTEVVIYYRPQEAKG